MYRTTLLLKVMYLSVLCKLG
ncbi:hypothetical protein F383_34631 [Gossypium arboreum]|uniref:Uncharacterized protein n=1 Tax=Gossypium arboreum TaxID=29729 RepID=A0A0B0PSQ6_GOSAR|nr:hypothetical protein F383_34631 [Gossypium arboreum]